jgi:putative addiction module component (TIGR02574 family)
MNKRVSIPPPGFDDLSVEEQIDYVQDLWDWIAARPEDIPVPAWQKAVIDERLRAHAANPADAVPWEEVRERLLQKYSTKSE